MKSLYRGIEPIIAVVILVAVTLVIAIGVIGWIMGWWGTLGASESIKVYPDSYITISGGIPTLYLHIKNEGTAAAVIYKVEVVGVGTVDTEETLPPGAEATKQYSIQGGIVIPGTRYTVKIYTKAGNVITAVVEARA